MVAAEPSPSDFAHECLWVPFSLCLGGGGKPLTGDARPKDLIGLWDFDDAFGADSSGHSLHAVPPPPVGAARYGQGASAYFNGTSFVTIPHGPGFNTAELSVSLWVYLLEDSQGGWRTLFHKGADESQLTPALMLWPKERRLHVRVSTQASYNEGLDSVAVLPLRRWTHIAVVLDGLLLQLYVNGMLDAQVVTKGPNVFNTGPFYLGGDPWHAGTAAFVDTLRIYSRPLSPQEVQVEAEGSLGTVGPHFTRLGCKACSAREALSSCSDGFHQCSNKELFTGGYQVARAQGWVRHGTKFWSSDILDKLNAAQRDAQDYRLALCCKDD
eukprot:PLAT15059.1.p1 GENE.PLAT15059.1~~PLAT15059.1.p1  ORF type:complete len:344 (+),score=145.55 PLAT15059.1:55-1032(+)